MGIITSLEAFKALMVNIPKEKTIMMPIMEDAQLGICTGLSLTGKIPLCLYTRMDFMLLALNQLINHLDKLEELSHGEFKAKVIIRTVVGETKPMYPGPQHTQDFSDMLKLQLKTIDLYQLEKSSDILPIYKKALNSNRSSIIVEYRNLYNKE